MLDRKDIRHAALLEPKKVKCPKRKSGKHAFGTIIGSSMKKCASCGHTEYTKE